MILSLIRFIKRKFDLRNKNVLVCYQRGFCPNYHFYNDDAKKVAEILELPLDKIGENIAYFEFIISGYEENAKKIVNAGYRVDVNRDIRDHDKFFIIHEKICKYISIGFNGGRK